MEATYPPGTEQCPSSHLSLARPAILVKENTRQRHSDEPLAFDNDEALRLLQAAGFSAVAAYVTERAGGRPHQNVRLVSLFDPRLVNLWLMGPIDHDVENPVADHSLDTAPVSHAFSLHVSSGD